jgi:hypothetical protein
MNPAITRVLVKIHGIGNQPQNWSKDFDAALAAQLPAAKQATFVNQSVWWADLSSIPGAPVTAAVAPAGTTAITATQQAAADYAAHLEVQQAAAAGATAGLGSVIGGLVHGVFGFKDGPVSVADHVADVANYIGNNRVRLAIQERLATALFGAQRDFPNAGIILGSHSQGTIIAYDVLRLLAGQLPAIDTWVTMGCPLGWYLGPPNWGDNEIELPGTVQWLNWYDPKDFVGQDLQRLARWTPAAPQDTDVDNVGHGLDAHDHWHNPVVIAGYAALI